MSYPNDEHRRIAAKRELEQRLKMAEERLAYDSEAMEDRERPTVPSALGFDAEETRREMVEHVSVRHRELQKITESARISAEEARQYAAECQKQLSAFEALLKTLEGLPEQNRARVTN